MRVRWLLVTLLLHVLGLVVGAGVGTAAAQGSIKIGFLSPMSGAIAQAGKDMYSGCELYWQETGWRLGDRKLEVILEDTEGQPATAVSKLRKLIDSDRVNLVAGVILSNVAYALVPPIEAAGIPTIYPINSADDLTQRKRPKWLVRTGFSAGGNMHPFGEYAAKVLKYKKVVTIGLDYAFGWETVGGFHKSFEDNGGQVIQKLWVPLNVQDYAPYLAQVKRDADAVFVVALGRWTVLFAKQYAESALQGRIPLIAGGTYSDEHVLSQLGDESIGVISAHHYSASLDTPANRKFRAAFDKAYSRSPSFYSENCYTGARVITEAVKAVQGHVEDRAALMAALRRVEITDAPRGPIKIDAYGNPTQNIYIRKVERVGGVLQNTVIHTYPAVSQFWTYDPQMFLEQPVYSRDFPHASTASTGSQAMTMSDKFEYFTGIPEVGIVPRAPHAGPLLQHLYEQEHGRGGFAGHVTHTYHLYPPNNWLPGETRVVEGFAPLWESPMRPVGGVHHALSVARPAEPRDVYRGMARLVANATVAMNVTAPAASMDYFFEHHSATLVFFVHQGGGTLETLFGPIAYGPGDFLIVPKGIPHRFETAPGPQYYWAYESFAGDPEKSEAPTTGQFITHSRSDYRYPRTLDTRNEAGRFEIVSKVGAVYTRRVHPTHPFDVVGWRGDYLPYRFAVEDVRPLTADRSHVPPSGHTVFKLPGCYLCVFTVRSVEKEGMWLPFFHRNLDYCETIGYHFGDFFSRGGVIREGMVTVHPVGLPHGPQPSAQKALMDGFRPPRHNEVGIMADFVNPAQISDYALGLSQADYMKSWDAYTTDPRFVHRPERLAEVRALAERLADARDELRPRPDAT